MSRGLQNLIFAALTLAALWALVEIVTFDIPFGIGLSYADAKDRNHPGHLIGLGPTLPQLTLHATLIVLWTITFRRRRSNR